VAAVLLHRTQQEMMMIHPFPHSPSWRRQLYLFKYTNGTGTYYSESSAPLSRPLSQTLLMECIFSEIVILCESMDGLFEETVAMGGNCLFKAGGHLCSI
jgi:hypothetical protein